MIHILLCTAFSQIPIEKLDFKAKAASKVGSLDNVKHKPKGGEKKIFDDKEYLKQMSSSNASPCKTPTSKTSSGRESGAIVSIYIKKLLKK